jgi:Tfp pilus assembly protein PilF
MRRLALVISLLLVIGLLAGCGEKKQETAAKDITPKTSEEYTERGFKYYKEGKYDLALADYDTAIKLEPKNGKAYSRRGCVYAAQEKFDLAIADGKKAIELEPHKVRKDNYIL